MPGAGTRANARGRSAGRRQGAALSSSACGGTGPGRRVSPSRPEAQTDGAEASRRRDGGRSRIGVAEPVSSIRAGIREPDASRRAGERGRDERDPVIDGGADVRRRGPERVLTQPTGRPAKKNPSPQPRELNGGPTPPDTALLHPSTPRRPHTHTPTHFNDRCAPRARSPQRWRPRHRPLHAAPSTALQGPRVRTARKVWRERRRHRRRARSRPRTACRR